MAEPSRVLYYEGPTPADLERITIHALQSYRVAVQHRNPAYWHETPQAEMFVAAIYVDTARWPDIVACYEEAEIPVHDLTEFSAEEPPSDASPKRGPGRPRSE